eukprot:3513680-Ditylum_brightwellii.AAC.2
MEEVQKKSISYMVDTVTQQTQGQTNIANQVVAMENFADIVQGVMVAYTKTLTTSPSPNLIGTISCHCMRLCNMYQGTMEITIHTIITVYKEDCFGPREAQVRDQACFPYQIMKATFGLYLDLIHNLIGWSYTKTWDAVQEMVNTYSSKANIIRVQLNGPYLVLLKHYNLLREGKRDKWTSERIILTRLKALEGFGTGPSKEEGKEKPEQRD